MKKVFYFYSSKKTVKVWSVMIIWILIISIFLFYGQDVQFIGLCGLCGIKIFSIVWWIALIFLIAPLLLILLTKKLKSSHIKILEKLDPTNPYNKLKNNNFIGRANFFEKNKLRKGMDRRQFYRELDSLEKLGLIDMNKEEPRNFKIRITELGKEIYKNIKEKEEAITQ